MRFQKYQHQRYPQLWTYRQCARDREKQSGNSPII